MAAVVITTEAMRPTWQGIIARPVQHPVTQCFGQETKQKQDTCCSLGANVALEMSHDDVHDLVGAGINKNREQSRLDLID